MTIVINGTTGISGVDGSAGTPAVQGTDTNTGVFYPAADTVGVSTGGSERMRVDSSGNVGIGTSTNNVYDNVAAGRPLVVQSSSSATTAGSSTNAITISNSDTTTNNLSQLNFAAVTGANASQFSAAWIACQYGARTNGQYPTGQLIFATSTSLNNAPSEKMRIDSSGNVGIGQTSQVWDEKLGVRLATSGSGTVGLGVYSASTTYASSMIRVQSETSGSGWKMYEGRAAGGSQLFWVDGSGGAYFAGNVGIGTSSPAQKLHVAGSIQLDANNLVRWVASGTLYGSIAADSSNNLIFYTGSANTEVGRFDNAGLFKFNSGYGSVATAYGCRAWVNFNGTGTVAIRASGNVTSITDNGVGLYGVNLTNAMPDANYATIADSNVDNTTVSTGNGAGSGGISAAVSTTLFKVGTGNTAGPADMAYISAAAFR